MNDTMHAISQDELGGPEVLEHVTVARPEPGIGEVLVRVHAAGVNPADVLNRQTGVFAGELPFVLGWDVSGIVEAIGPGVTIHRPGDPVFGMLPFPHGHGAYAEYAVGPARAFVPTPDRFDHVQDAAVPLAGLTAWQALGRHHPGHRRPRCGAGDRRWRLPGQGSGRAEARRRPGLDLAPTLADIEDDAHQRKVRLAGLFVEADGPGMRALAELANAGTLTPTIAATFPLAQAAAAQSTRSGPGKTVLTLA